MTDNKNQEINALKSMFEEVNNFFKIKKNADGMTFIEIDGQVFGWRKISLEQSFHIRPYTSVVIDPIKTFLESANTDCHCSFRV